MIHDSQRGFSFSELNSLLSRAFSRQDFLFYSIMTILSILFTNWADWKNIILKFAKSMSKPPLIWLICLTSQANFGIMLSYIMMKSYVCVPLLINIYTKTCNKATIYVNEWLLIPVSPSNIKWKKVNLKETCNSPKKGPLNFEKKMIAQLQKMFCKIPVRLSLLCYFANLLLQECCLILRGN